MKTTDWRNDPPTEKQIETFNSLRSNFSYPKTPKTKGEYRDAITYLLKSQSDYNEAFQDSDIDVIPLRNQKQTNWMDFYDDDYLGDQGIFPGY